MHIGQMDSQLAGQTTKGQTDWHASWDHFNQWINMRNTSDFNYKSNQNVKFPKNSCEYTDLYQIHPKEIPHMDCTNKMPIPFVNKHCTVTPVSISYTRVMYSKDGNEEQEMTYSQGRIVQNNTPVIQLLPGFRIVIYTVHKLLHLQQTLVGSAAGMATQILSYNHNIQQALFGTNSPPLKQNTSHESRIDCIIYKLYGVLLTTVALLNLKPQP